MQQRLKTISWKTHAKLNESGFGVMHQILGQCLEKSGLAGSILDQLHKDLFQDLESMAWTGLNLEFEGHLLEILEGAK
jgi:hypothetical protein